MRLPTLFKEHLEGFIKDYDQYIKADWSKSDRCAIHFIDNREVFFVAILSHAPQTYRVEKHDINAQSNEGALIGISSKEVFDKLQSWMDLIVAEHNKKHSITDVKPVKKPIKLPKLSISLKKVLIFIPIIVKPY